MSLCSERHSYLLRGFSCVKGFNPRLINRLMDRELSARTTHGNLEPPFLRLDTTTPVTYAPNVDATRAKVAFGRWALPKLKKEIHHDDILQVMQALNSIQDLVHDPEKGFQAIRIGLVDRLTDMMLNERDFVREKVCMILHAIGGSEAGKRVIIRRYKILKNLALLLSDEVDAVRCKAQLVVETISRSPTAGFGLNCADYLVLILRLLGGQPRNADEDSIILHLATLKMLLIKGVHLQALKHNALDVLLEKIEHEKEQIKILALECMASLCEHPEGRAEAADKNVGTILCKKLFDPSMDVRIKVAGALAFATIQSDTRRRLSRKCTVDNLFEILENFHSAEGQLMAMKVLSNISEDAIGKSLVRKLKKKIKTVFTNNDDEVERHKKMLINLLKKK